MVLFCHQYFTPQRCVKGGSAGPEPKSGAVKLMGAPGETEAIDLARHGSKEIRDEWEKLSK
ncbi:hypothetical protein FXB41_29385 [Bradyrhizobium canariense]|uniref:hypothetical protein n=1 Tax=Bradyrhizobium canariense TaxID=255045 RepID=UPI001CA537FD|nr:hypothetical protein [Bradyrhizobium canariense]MBW5438731.1 hypothetical protein [Bradyrhizobium canariense]